MSIDTVVFTVFHKAITKQEFQHCVEVSFIQLYNPKFVTYANRNFWIM